MTEQALHGTPTPPLINATAGAYRIELYCGTRTTSCDAAVVVMNASSSEPAPGLFQLHAHVMPVLPINVACQ
jgi:hypothetical protein